MMSEESSGNTVANSESPQTVIKNNLQHSNGCPAVLTEKPAENNTQPWLNHDSQHTLESQNVIRRRFICGHGRNGRRIMPEDGPTEDCHFVETRKHRKLRVVHLNRRDRDPEFEKIMSKSLLYRDQKLRMNGKVPKPPKNGDDSHSNVKLLSMKTISSVDREDAKDIRYENSEKNGFESNDDLDQTKRRMVSTIDEDRAECSLPGSSSSEIIFGNAKTYSTVIDHTDIFSQVLVKPHTGSGADTLTGYTEEGDVTTYKHSESHSATRIGDLDVHSEYFSHSSKADMIQHCGSPLHHSVKNTQQHGESPLHDSVKNSVMFLIHGVAGSADIWLNQIEHFQKLGYEIVAPDLIGHGFSSAPDNKQDYDFMQIVDDMLFIFDMFCKQKNVVIGHSYGASFATVIARKRQRRVSRLILINGGGPIPLAPHPGIFSLPVCMLVCAHPLLKRGFNKQAFHKDTKSFESREKAFDIPSYVLRHTMMGQNWLEGGEEYHKALCVPTLLIHGVQDQLVSVEEELAMQETVYGAQLKLVDNAGHMTMMEQPEEVNGLIQEFIMAENRVKVGYSPVSPRRALMKRESTIRW